MDRLGAILFRFTSAFSALMFRLFHGTTALRMFYRPLVRKHFRRRMAKALAILIVFAFAVIGVKQIARHEGRAKKIAERAVSVKNETPFPDGDESSDSTDKESEQPQQFALVHPTYPAKVWDAKTKQWRIQEDSPTLHFALLRNPEVPLPKAKEKEK